MFQSYKRARYAGNVFRTQASQVNLKGDDSHVRFDYRAAEGGDLTKGFATIIRMFEHEAYPGGPSRVVLEGAWWQVVGTCPVAGTTLVKKNVEHPFNYSSRFVFLDECYQTPSSFGPTTHSMSLKTEMSASNGLT